MSNSRKLNTTMKLAFTGYQVAIFLSVFSTRIQVGQSRSVFTRDQSSFPFMRFSAHGFSVVVYPSAPGWLP